VEVLNLSFYRCNQCALLSTGRNLALHQMNDIHLDKTRAIGLWVSEIWTNLSVSDLRWWTSICSWKLSSAWRILLFITKERSSKEVSLNSIKISSDPAAIDRYVNPPPEPYFRNFNVLFRMMITIVKMNYALRNLSNYYRPARSQ